MGKRAVSGINKIFSGIESSLKGLEYRTGRRVYKVGGEPCKGKYVFTDGLAF